LGLKTCLSLDVIVESVSVHVWRAATLTNCSRQMKCGQMGWKTDWYLTTQENKWHDEHAKLSIDKQVERNGECGK